MILSTLPRASIRSPLRRVFRCISTLPNNTHIYVFPNSSSTKYTLSLLPTDPPTSSLAIGTTPTIPPTPSSLTENPHFITILHSVLREHAAQDPQIQSQAAAFASSSGSALGSGGMFFPQQKKQRRGRVGGDGAGGASSQGGAGGGGRGGFVHVSDSRAPPDYGRIAWPEDIFGSLEVDAEGRFVDGEDGVEAKGRYQESGSYRVVTREGILGLSDFLREKLVQRLRDLEKRDLVV